MPYLSGSGALLLVTLLGIPALTNAAENIDMSKVRALAALPVKEIFRDSPVRELPRASYWKTIRESPIPVVVMFYSNVDPESQRLATLVRYISIKYKDKISTYRVIVAANGNARMSAVGQPAQIRTAGARVLELGEHEQPV